MQLFLCPSKLLISISLTLCIFISGCGGGGGSTGTSNASTISSVSIGQENIVSSATSIAASSVNNASSSFSSELEKSSASRSSSHSESQTASSVASNTTSSVENAAMFSSSQGNSSASISHSVIPNISSIDNSSSNSKEPSPSSSATTSISAFSSISASASSTAISSALSSVIRSSSKAATSSAYSSSLTQISSSSIASSSSTLSSSSLTPTGIAFHLRGTHNAWIEGDLFTQVVGSTTDLEICRNFSAVAGGAMFKIDPDGGWGNDAFPISSLVTSGWTKVVINGNTKDILVFDKNLAPNCGNESSSTSSSSNPTEASSSSIASSSLNSFAFPSVYDVPLNTEILSAPITISGVELYDFLSIQGGEYSVNNSAFTKIEASITNGDTVVLKVKSAAKHNASKQATLTIVGREYNRTASFTVTTLPDITPDAFSLTSIQNSQLNIARYSESILVSGIDVAVPISISGEKASYSINNKAYSNTSSTVTNGQMVKVQLRSSDTVNTTTTAVLTIGNISRTFTVSTVAEDSPPSAEFMFPSPLSLTNKSTILVRGKANDLSTIASVKVNNIEVTTNDNYKNWQAVVPLEEGENTLMVSTRDSLGNYIYNAATLRVRQGLNSTPDEINRFDGPLSIVMDKARNRLIVSDSATVRETPESALYAVNLANGARTPFNTSSVWLTNASDMVIDEAHNRILAVDESMGYITSMDLTYGIPTPFSNYNIPYGPAPRLSVPCCIALDTARNRAIVADYGLGQLIAVDLTSGAYNVFSSNTIPNSNNKFYKPYGIVIDGKNNRALVLDSNYLTGLVISVDLTTGARKTLEIARESTGTMLNPKSIVIDEKRNRALVSEMRGGNTVSIDLTTGVIAPFDALPNSNKIVIDSEKDVAYSASYWLKSVILVDLVTNESVTFSK